jgi:hypothetical protein
VAAAEVWETPLAEASAPEEVVAFGGVEEQGFAMDAFAETPVFAAEPPPTAAAVESAVPVVATATPIPAAVTLDEEQLKALLAKVSREVIEKIVWEVVPDLAEILIKEEIKKLKAGTGE